MRRDLSEQIRKCLDTKYEDENGKSHPIHELISWSYLDWNPRKNDSDLYELSWIFLCSDAAAEEILDRIFLEKLDPYLKGSGKNGIKILSLICRAESATFITDLHGYERLSDWDFLSEMGDIVYAPPSKC